MRSSRPASSNSTSPPTLHFQPFVPIAASGFSRGPQCPAPAARALVPSRYCPFPEDPLLPASLSFLRPRFPLQLPRMASPPGSGTARFRPDSRMQRLVGVPIWVIFFRSPLTRSVFGTTPHPPPHPPLPASLPSHLPVLLLSSS